MSVIHKSQAASLDSVMLGGAKRVTLGCSSKTSNEVVYGDMYGSVSFAR